VVSLTRVYLEARFGGDGLTDATRREFERRVRDIRAFRALESAPRGSGPAGTVAR
jgi:hypothetical protein